MINLQANLKLQGEYNIVVKRDNETISETGWFKNLILDQGLDRIGTQGNVAISYAQIGSGTTPPNASDTSLQTYVAGSQSNPTATSYTNSGSPDYYGLLTYTFTFTQGSVVGTMGEVGVGWTNTSGNLFSRALILDGSGNPTTISLTSIDQLVVYYRLRIYPPTVDVTGSVTIGSTPYNYTVRACRATQWANDTLLFYNTTSFNKISVALFYEPGCVLNPITSNFLNGTQTPNGAVSSVAVGSYSGGSYYLDNTVSAGVSEANGTGGFQGIVFLIGSSQLIGFQMVFDNPIPKDNTKQFTITMRYSWARV